MFERRIGIVVLVLSAALAAPSQSATIEEQTPALVKLLVEQLVAKEKNKVAAIDFTDLQGRPNELGRYIAEQVTTDLVVLGEGVSVMDRSNLSAVMAEHQLTAEGLVNPDNAKKLGEFAGVDAVIIGNIAQMDSSCTLTVKAISTETAEIVAAGRMHFDMTKDIQRMLGLKVDMDGGPAASGARASASEGEALATQEVGPLTAVLRNVMRADIQGDSGTIPAIQCTFELENRNLRSFVAVAGNQSVFEERHAETVKAFSCRGELFDASQRRWEVPLTGFKGIASVYCFESVRSSSLGGPKVTISQNSPTSIATYVRNGNRHDFKGVPSNGMHWAGGFTTVLPGKSTRLTVSFVPSEYLEKQKNRKSRQSDQPEKVVWPDYFQLDLELVVGTYADGEEPVTSSDLSLRNLTIDRIVLPASTTATAAKK